MEHSDSRELEAAVEGILFASGEPIQTERICLALELEREEVETILHRLRDYYAFERRGMRLLQLEDRWQLCSSPDHADVIRKAFEIRKPAKLSQPALEALTIIAYYQPTTRAYVDKLRGVDSSYTVGLLLERGLIETCGNLQAPGRPLLYRTTEKFLRSFHISSLEELPPLNEDDIPPQQLKIEDIALAQRLTESESVTEAESVSETDAPPEAENVSEAEAAPEAESVTETESAPEITNELTETAPEAESVSETETAPEAESVSETETAPEVESVSEPESAPETESMPELPEEAVEIAEELPEETEIAEELPEAAPEVTDEPPTLKEALEPPRELLSAYPQILTARASHATRPSRRKPSPRKRYRYAGAFRTRRKRPGRPPRKRRKIARPRHAPRSHAEASAAPDCHSEASPAPQTNPAPETFNPAPETFSAAGTRRRLSGKAMRRCFYCLLCGCWLSWPFC